MYNLKKQYKIKINFLLFLIILFFYLILSVMFLTKYNDIIGSKMNIIETPQWYKNFIKDKNDISCIKNTIIFAYEELIEKILLLKDLPVNELNSNDLFEKSYELIEQYNRNLEKHFSALRIYNHLGKEIELKNDIQKAFNDINSFFVQNFTYNIDIYNILFSIGNFLLTTKNLKNNKKKLIENTLNEYRRLGINLSEEKKNRLKEIDIILTDISINFDMNIQMSKNSIIASKNELTGLSDLQIERLERIENDNYKIGIDYPTYSMIMAYCSNSDIRKKLYKEFNTRAYPENIDNLLKIRRLKDEKAKILGYINYPEFDFENQMAKNIIQVERLFTMVNEATAKKAIEEKKTLTEFAKKEVFKDLEYIINPWDTAYIAQLYENKYYNIDQEKISEYFAVHNTINKLLELYSTFFDIDMQIIEYDDNSWKFEDSIKVIRISKKNGQVIGDLILDLYPRENKYSHACFDSMVSAVLKKGSDSELIEIPIGLIIANFNKPTDTHDGLLKYSEVRTLFHEFGHALHGLFGATEFFSQSGTNVSADFVETPSQLFEQWLLQEDLIKSISSHYKTKEPLPKDLINKIIEIEFYDMGLFFQRQINLSLLALELFLYPEKSPSLIIDELANKTIRLSYIDSLSQFVYSFGHLSSSLYGPKYYVYLWSLVYAIDFFYFIKSQDGLLNSTIGKKLKDTVLSKGGSEDPFVLLERFLGRQSSIDNFYKYINSYN
jgi:thimet oligopeptidase